VGLGFILNEMANGLRRNLSMTVASVLTVAIAMVFLGAAWLLHVQVNTMKDYWFGKIQISVFLKQDVTQPERDAIRQQLQALPQVQQVFYESKEQAYQHFREQFKSLPALVKNVGPTTLPESYRVKLKDPHQFAVVSSAVQNMPGVDTVGDASAALKRFFRSLDGFQHFALVSALLVLMAAVLLIYNTVRLAAFSRRRETGIMRLVGASDMTIQGPFVLETVVSSIVGAVIAGALLLLVKAWIIDHLVKGAFGQLVRIINYSVVLWTIPFLVLLSIVIAAVTSYGTLQRYLRV
jgi:cell division transport system permease protein